ncbi:MAG: SPOR domain-containing protein [Candidatus Omnitrophica bacterium]|nr:SPOR domain-containing protein [Candidatus Omnitrophota bacterium]
MSEKQLHLFGYDEGKESKKRYTVIVPLDTLILLLIVVVLLFTLSFSLGVERGRKIVYLSADDKNKVFEPTAELTANTTLPAQAARNVFVQNSPTGGKITSQTTAVSLAGKSNTIIIPSNKVEPAVVDNKKNTGKTTTQGKRYVIQVASYSENELAQKEAKKLEKKGYPVFVSKKGKYSAVFVGEFKEKQEAVRNEKLLEQTYGPCVLRTL